MITLTKLNDVFENWATGDGIFTDLDSLSPPWKNTEDTSANTQLIKNLNMAYHGSHSGDKNISPIVHKFLTSEDTNTRGKLANIIFTMFADKWSKLWDALEIEYNPLENYNMREIETPAEITHTTTPAETTETITPAETTETTKPAKTTTENEVSAFNSSGYSDNEKTTITGDNNDKGSNKFEVDTAGTNKFEVDSAGTNKFEVDSAGTNKFEVDSAGTNKFEVDSAGSDVLTVQNARELTRSGNIGVTTSQMMLQSEIELRKWLYYQNVFNDIDTILTLSIY